jgi:hypothetical protein
MTDQQNDTVGIVPSYVYILRTLEKEEIKGIVTTSKSVYHYRVSLGIGFEKIIDEQEAYIQQCQIVVVFGTSPVFFDSEDADAYSLKLLKNTSGNGIRRLKYDKGYPIEIPLLTARQQLRYL